MTHLLKLGLFFGLSLGLHLLMVGSLQLVQNVELEIPPKTEVLEFEVKEAPEMDLSKTAGVPKVGGSKKATKVAKQLMMGLKPQSFAYDREAYKGDPTHMVAHADFTDPATYDDVDGMGSEFGEYGFFHKEIYRLVDTRLLYQSLLAQYKHRGWVYFKLDVDADGKIISESLRGSADDGILKVHSARAIRSALSEAINENKRPRKFARSTFFLRFYYGPEGHEQRCRAGAKGLMLTFCRFASEKAVSKTLTEHVLTGGVHVNPFVTVERWQQYQAAKRRSWSDLDPFYDYRKDPDYNL